ncbi:DUF6442 family protein [Amedibacterium intestinale]|uniref:DUF6442 family protein n=1 Tax=Amedibacterium intestinale TaxID=2583452 RepID=UPI000E201DED
MKREEILRRARKNKDNEFENRIKNRYFIFMGCVFGIFIVGIAVYLNSIGLSLQSNVLIVAANFLLFVGMPFYFFLIKKEMGYLLIAFIGFMLFCFPALIKIFNYISS